MSRPATPYVRNARPIDMSVVHRITHFREKYISKKQTDAAPLLGIPQPTLSSIEAGKRTISQKVLTAYITKYNLNTEWLTTGNGDPQRKPESGSAMARTLHSLEVEITTLKGVIKMFEAQQTHLFNRLETMNKRLDAQEERINQLTHR
ncbi:helix-turn-helix domain-containing protein [Pedobacter faecalis]|uniref:helix-turn-helix domain-containing protein n=1 Tax=Pedobacter faecalis TaxID=3041495 RepID=UPI0025507ED0|nr:helix-turn-helix transcriptional regulator [Pedobacter sp. ELA7]